MANVLVFGFVCFLGYGCWKYLNQESRTGLARAPLFSTLYTFLTKPALEAMELAYWPLLFKDDIMETWFLGKWWVGISDPSLIRQVLQQPGLSEKNLFTELSPHALIGEYMGTNVLYSKGKEWRRHRKVINPAFHHEWSPSAFVDCADSAVRAIRKNPCHVNARQLFSAMTLDALGKTVLGVGFNAVESPGGECTRAYYEAATGVSKMVYFMFPFLELLPIPSRQRERAAVLRFRAFVERIIQEKRTQLKTESCQDLLTLMIQASQDAISDRELINNTVVMFAAGHDTSANTLSFTLYHLCKNPRIQEKARKLIKHLPRVPTHAQLKELTYLDAIIMESMRITPTLPQLRRVLEKDLLLDSGRLLPKGSLILLQTYAAMNHPKHWDSPSQFLPERFLTHDSQLHHQVSRNFFGFGAGTRACVGLTMSMMEQKITLISLLANFSFSLPKGSIHHRRIITNRDPVCRPIDLHIDFHPISS